NGKLERAQKALKIGLVDQLVHPGILMDQAMKLAKEAIDSGKKRKKYFKPKGTVAKLLEGPGKGVVFGQAKKTVIKFTSGHYPAPLKAIEVIKKTYGMRDREKALNIEREAFCECGITDISKNLIHVFDLTEMVKKQTGIKSEAK